MPRSAAVVRGARALVVASVAVIAVLLVISRASAAATTVYVSDLPYTVAANGWGPVEKDKSNGESGSGDGRTITLDGVTYTKGLGTHAASDVSVALNSCTRFQASVGVDDEVGSNGSVVFQVYVDGVTKYESPVLRGSSATATVDVDVTGGKTLRLVVTNGGDNTSYDHADWASARVTCSATQPTSVSSQTSGGSTSTGVVAPASPSTYSLPSGAVRVTSVAQLKSALTGSNKNIVLADGTYDAGSYITVDGVHNLYAEHLGKAVLKSGLLVGSSFTSGGGTIRGLTFDVSSTSRTHSGNVLENWGPGGVNIKILDTVFRGNGVIPYGIRSINPQGLDIERSVFTNFTDGAIRASFGSAVSYGGSTPSLKTISDVQVDGVCRPSPGSSGGTAEAGIFLGHPVSGGVNRVRIRNVCYAGITSANNSWNTTFSNLDIDMGAPSVPAGGGVGVYLEHFNYHNTFQNFIIKAARMGFNAEWSDPSWGGVAGSHYSKITNGTIDAAGAPFTKTWGVYLDEGTDSTTVTYVTFRNQSFAAIDAYKNVGTNVFQNNDTSGILSTAKPISYVHFTSPAP
jgi:hypothetical protein